RRSDAVGIRHGGVRRGIQEDIVERRVVADTEAAADDGLILTHQASPHARRPREPYHRTDIVVDVGYMWNSGLIQGKTRIPEGIRTCLLLHCEIMQQI